MNRLVVSLAGVLLPLAAWAQPAPPIGGPTQLLPPSRSYPSEGIQSEPLAPPPGSASPSLMAPGMPQPAPGQSTQAPAPGFAAPIDAAPMPGAAASPPGPPTAMPGTAAPQGGSGTPAAGTPPTGTPPTGTPPAGTPPAPNPWEARHSAVLQILDKPDAQSTMVTVPVGQSVTHRSLTIKVQSCMVRPPDMPADATAFLVITDQHSDQPGFQGWMDEADPSLNMLQNPIYDVRLKGCGP